MHTLIVALRTTDCTPILAYLQACDYGVTVVTSATEAVWFLRSLSVDLLLIDLDLPGEEGLHLSNSVQQPYPDLVVIFLSGRHHVTSERMLVFDMGADDIISLPCESAELYARYLAHRRRRTLFSSRATSI